MWPERQHVTNAQVTAVSGMPIRRSLWACASVPAKVMLGCMLESSPSLIAAAHLAPLADYGDLDAHLLLEEDPFEGFETDHGKILLPQRPGVGVLIGQGRLCTPFLPHCCLKGGNGRWRR